MKRTAWVWIIGVTTALLSMPPVRAGSNAPGNTADEALVQKPIIVVARWPRAAAERHDLIRNRAVLQVEVHTQLIVDRGLKGDITPGRYKLRFGWGVDWQEEGSQPENRTLSERLGEVEDVTRPNLWFLSRARSWDKADSTVYLSLDTYRGVQPVGLEPYFAALQGNDREQKVTELLHSKNDAVRSRALVYLLDSSGSSSATWHCMNADPRAFNRMLTWLMVAVLTKKSGILGVRQLLNDEAPEMRMIAARLLLDRRDETSALRVGSEIARMARSRFDCALVESLAAWGNQGLVPALIACLQTDTFEGWDRDIVKIPAVEAQAALRRITGYTFPLDVQSSQRAWAKAQRFKDAAVQRKSLADSLGNDPNPLQATAVEDRGQAAIQITNKSRQQIVIASRPTEVEVDWGRGNGIRRPEPAAGEATFVRLRPGQSTRFSLQVYREFLDADHATRQITLLYTRNGNELGVNAWIGLLRLTLDDAPAGQRDGAPIRCPD